ncbi:MAG: S8 family serine peptidase, partial [Candidatus Cloacimonetes bacterium]|nr:S8 family serine peptidase [Candidatus Cloacimonadota bacterium]
MLERTNIEILQQLSLDLASLYQIRHQEAILIATEKGWPIKQVREDGSVIELQFLRDGFPVYYVTGNGVSAETISTNQVRPGGTTGLNLDGTGMVLYEWDAGKVLLSHQELTGRITIGDPASNTDLHDHSTHVAGTLIAAGIDMSAVGMAYNGTLIDYDWDDDNSEMSAAGAGGALISNHSYSFITGWYYNYRNDGLWCWFGDTTVSETEDYYFGFYDSEAQAWDNIAYNAPYLLICKSAGNDRTDCGPEPGGQHWVWDPDLDNWVYSWQTRDPDGDYDCIGTRGSAKNLLTVGAVNDIQGGYEEVADVVATSFTSWGPPDDGRIKPDVVANGQHLWSPISTGNTDYAFKSGTSMSTPSVAGSAALLQEHYSERYRDYMLSSTLKGLIINTADEAGPNPGPDYMFGWGLMNTRTAADAITDKDEYSLIIEEELANGESYEISVTPNIAETLTATLCWTDIPGTPVTPQVDPLDPMLVNDLDMRITRPGFTAYPWKLNPSNPTAAASNNSDNPVDNVEKIEISNPEPEIHTITITHKGTLTSP